MHCTIGFPQQVKEMVQRWILLNTSKVSHTFKHFLELKYAIVGASGEYSRGFSTFGYVLDSWSFSTCC